MPFDKYSRLKIASNVLGQTMIEIADEWGCTTQAVRDVCTGRTTSARIENLINEKIEEAEQKYDEYKRLHKAPVT